MNAKGWRVNSGQRKVKPFLTDHIRYKTNLFLRATENAKKICIYLRAHCVFASGLKEWLERKYNISKLEEHSAVGLPGPYIPQGNFIDLYHI